MSVTFISGSMFGGKSKRLIDIALDLYGKKQKFIVYKPTTDTRDGLYIRSRDSKFQIEALPWYTDDNRNTAIFIRRINFLSVIKEYTPSILFDEVHFLSVEDIQFIVRMCKLHNINLYMGGLETDFKLNHFPASEWLHKNCDNYEFHYGVCNWCEGPEAVFNILFQNGERVTEGDSIFVGDSEYKVVCGDCLKYI